MRVLYLLLLVIFVSCLSNNKRRANGNLPDVYECTEHTDCTTGYCLETGICVECTENNIENCNENEICVANHCTPQTSKTCSNQGAQDVNNDCGSDEFCSSDNICISKFDNGEICCKGYGMGTCMSQGLDYNCKYGCLGQTPLDINEGYYFDGSGSNLICGNSICQEQEDCGYPNLNRFCHSSGECKVQLEAGQICDSVTCGPPNCPNCNYGCKSGNSSVSGSSVVCN